jgi:hypothetical protein
LDVLFDNDVSTGMAARLSPNFWAARILSPGQDEIPGGPEVLAGPPGPDYSKSLQTHNLQCCTPLEHGREYTAWTRIGKGETAEKTNEVTNSP